MDKTNKTPKKCLGCGVSFIPQSNAQKYCKTCAYVVWYEKKVKLKKPGKVLKCDYCKQPIKRKNATKFCCPLHQRIGAYLLIIKAQEKDGYITRNQRIDLFAKYKIRLEKIEKQKKEVKDAVPRGKDGICSSNGGS